jgi:hypothetical protein
LLLGIGADDLQVVVRLFGMLFLDVVQGGYRPHNAPEAEDSGKLKFGAVDDVPVKWGVPSARRPPKCGGLVAFRHVAGVVGQREPEQRPEQPRHHRCPLAQQETDQRIVEKRPRQRLRQLIGIPPFRRPRYRSADMGRNSLCHLLCSLALRVHIGRFAPIAGRLPLDVSLPDITSMVTAGAIFACSARLCASATGSACIGPTQAPPPSKRNPRQHRRRAVGAT